MKYTFEGQTFSINRYPATQNRSLQAWNAADELILKHVFKEIPPSAKLAIYNDRFGFLSCFLNGYAPETIFASKSQEKALHMNTEANGLSFPRSATPLSALASPLNCALVKIPKSMQLFRFYLHHISANMKDDGEVICGFMTKYFTPQILEAAGDFFEEAVQSKAQKKARVLILKGKKTSFKTDFLTAINTDGILPSSKPILQYPGVFSANTIDFATQFLLQNLHLRQDEERILDLACGNGILGYAAHIQAPHSEIHLQDDSLLAIESARLNLESPNAHFHYNDNLDGLEEDYFDLILSNPPFHFEFEINIEVAISLFHHARRCLKPSGRFLCVANQHLNYKTHLEKIFDTVKVMAENRKYVVYEAS